MPAPGTENYIAKLDWYGAKSYTDSMRGVWKVGENVAGYAREINGHFTQLLVRNAGHILPYDQPEFAMDMITKFIKGEPFKNS